MRNLKYILSILVALGLSLSLSAQYINIVCTGEQGVVYKVHGNPGSTFKWDVKGGTISADYGDSIKVNWGTSPGEYDLRVQEFSKFGCAAIPISGKVLVSAPVIDLGPDQEICEGQVIELLPSGTYATYLWSDGSVNPNYVGREQGAISLTVTDLYGCEAADEMLLTVHQSSELYLGPDTTLCGTQSLTLDAGSAVSYNWSTGQTGREITVYEGYQKISVTVTDEYGCSNQDEIIINACSSTDLFNNMPSAFTPNNDGKNDLWYIPQLQNFPNAVVEVFDRWGILVYKSESGYPKPWDGYSNGKEMPMDAYYYIINLNSPGLEAISGTVTLIK